MSVFHPLNFGEFSLKRYFNKTSAFSRNTVLTLAWFALVLLAFTFYTQAERTVDHHNVLRLTSSQLAGELRQSSGDLTRMVRSYVATGNPIYKTYYQEILDIRDGIKPRPADYRGIYWELVLADNRRPQADSHQKISILALAKSQGIPSEALTKLTKAKTSADRLTTIERKAMAMIEHNPPVSDTVRLQAVQMLHDDVYQYAKADVMRPLNEFNQLMAQKTQAALDHALKIATIFKWVLAACGMALIVAFWRTYMALRHTLGATVDDLHEHITRLGSGDITTPIPVTKGMSGSVMEWLSETQISLAKIDADEKAAKQHNQHLMQLYAALSQCNQAIVRCNDDQTLYFQVCNAAVSFGKMRLAWIGLLDEQTRLITPVASFGEGAEYLNGIHISSEADSPSGQGPGGTAVRENRPYWCQDFLNDPATLPWRERGAVYGWGSVACLPLHRKGKAIGVFTLYAQEANAFDTDARMLLEEMASDIDYALERFELEKEREHYREHLKISEESARLVLENSLDAVVNMDPGGLVTEWSGAAAEIFGYQREEVIGKSLSDVIVPAMYREAHEQGLKRFLNTGQSNVVGKVIEIHALHRSGGEFPVELSVARIRRGKETFFSAFIRDISERKSAEARIQFLANSDTLTGLPNRNQLVDRLKYAISLAHRTQEKIAIMFLDLDHFKDVNDTLGHSVGDLLLKELANRFRSSLREEDTVSRLGGDEFIFVLPNSDEYGATHVAEKLLQAIERPMVVDHHELSLSASIGISLYPNDGEDLETLLKNADVAMYKVKQESRNGYRFYTSKMQSQSARNLMLVNALRQAIKQNQLEVFYQPQIAVTSNTIIGVEALLRWHHPEIGMVSPAEFIPIAEVSGQIITIGEWVLRQSVRQAKQWMKAGYPPLIMAVNLSVAQFRDPKLPDLVSRILQEEDFPPEYLELELTEGVALEDPQGAIQLMDTLHARGVRMSIDDFGTGYSSLSHLKKFKVYKLKIDQSFVRDINADEEDKAIVIAIIHLARSLGLKTIAEGVETVEQLAFLRQQHCDEVQGYLFSKPLAANALEQLFLKS